MNDIINDIYRHAMAEYPRECCGAVVNGKYSPCRNDHYDPLNAFAITDEDFADLVEMGDIEYLVHSHPDGDCVPSDVDGASMLVHRCKWLIVSVHGGKECFHKVWDMDSEKPLIGREYYHGYSDCYSLVRDYYKQELGIELGDYPREPDWWESKEHGSMYLDNFKAENFVEVDDLRKHDIILCRVGRTEHINHALIYLGDGEMKSEPSLSVRGSDIILHHPHGRLSVRDIYGDSWRKRTSMIVRHKSLMGDSSEND